MSCMNHANINQFFQENRSYQERERHFPHIVCKNGFKLSVQASQFHYCKPREDKGYYTHVEISAKFENPKHKESLAEYHDGDGIYGFVPIQLIEQIINENGGISNQVSSDFIVVKRG